MKKLVFVFALVFSVIPCQANSMIIVFPGGRIQPAIDFAGGGDTVIVLDGIYTGIGNRDIDFKGKAITVRSANGPANCIINCGGMGRGFYFHSGEDGNSVISGFTITGGFSKSVGAAIACQQSSPTIRNNIIKLNSAFSDDPELSTCYGGGIYCWNSSAIITNNIISNNWVGGWGGGIYAEGSSLTLINNIITANAALAVWSILSSIGMGGGIHSSNSSLVIVNNTIADNYAMELMEVPGEGGGIYCWNSYLTLVNTILWNDSPEELQLDGISIIKSSYCDIQGGGIGQGNINLNPHFVSPGSWDFIDPRIGDYHLKSQAGRWNPGTQTWIHDAVTGPCIDAGDPNSDWTAELWPHGKRINMGAYGGTPEASMSLSNVGNVADLNNDDSVDCNDMALFMEKWLNNQVLLPEDLDRNGFVDFADFAIFGQQWSGALAAEPSITYQIEDCNREAPSLFASQSGQTRFTVTVEGRYIHFQDMMVANCCADELELEMIVEDNLIVIHEIEHTTRPCHCICDYPVTATLGPFEPGTYTLEVYEDFGGFIGSTVVTIGAAQ